jgi:2-keto-4-pentenoate hydratase/2-oxohepta-3-ene-1,7-dioic acid hydratase in catechol pathway
MAKCLSDDVVKTKEDIMKFNLLRFLFLLILPVVVIGIIVFGVAIKEHYEEKGEFLTPANPVAHEPTKFSYQLINPSTKSHYIMLPYIWKSLKQGRSTIG